MKTLTLSLLTFSLLSLSSTKAQEPVIEYPLFPGCGEGKSIEVVDCAEMKMMNFIFSNLKHPEEAKKAGITGEIEAKFTVALDGSIKSPSIVKGLGHGCDQEVLRLIAMMPKWVVGKENGAPKEIETYIYIKFK
jgi:protein TonB